MKSNNYYVLLVGLSTLIAGGLGYFYHPLMLRFLSIQQFGDFQAIVSIFGILSVFTTCFSVFYMSIFANSKNFQKDFSYSSNILLFFGFFLTILGIFFSPFISKILHIQSNISLVIAMVSILPSILVTPFSALVSTKQKFEFLSLINILNAVIRLIVGVGLVYAGYGVLGASIGYTLTAFTLFLFQYIFVTKNFGKLNFVGKDKTDWKSIKKLANFFWISLLIVIFSNIDILLVKSIFSPEVSGNYAAISVLTKVFLFVGQALESVYYPQLVDRKNFSSLSSNIKNIYILIIGLFLMSLIGAYFLGHFVLHLLKPGLENFSYLLPKLLLFNLNLIIISIFGKLCVSFGKNFVILLVLISLIISLVVIFSGEKNLNFVVDILIIFTTFISSFLSIYIFKNYVGKNLSNLN